MLENTEALTKILIDVLDDATLEFQAHGIAWYVLCVKHIPYETFVRQIRNHRDRVLTYLRKLIDCQSEFSTIMPLSIGIDHISSLASGKMQKSLDVKHLKSYNKKFSMREVIIPDIKPNILYSHNDFMWIRFFANSPNLEELQELIPWLKISFVQINYEVYELYIRKNKYESDTPANELNHIIDIVFEYLSKKKYDIIFCSELILFKFNTQLFISNFVKFMFCYSQSKDVFELDTPDDYIAFNHYLLNCCLFLYTKNLANMSEETHSPLNNYTAERPGVLLNKTKDSQIHVVEGNRPLLSTDKPSDIGTTSTRIEVVHIVELSSDVMDLII